MRLRTLCGTDSFTGPSCLQLILASPIFNDGEYGSNKEIYIPTHRNGLPPYPAIVLEVNFRDVDFRYELRKEYIHLQLLLLKIRVFLIFQLNSCATCLSGKYPSCTVDIFLVSVPLLYSG